MRYKVFEKRTGLRVSELGDTEPSRTRRGACYVEAGGNFIDTPVGSSCRLIYAENP